MQHDSWLIHAGLSIILIEKATSEKDAREQALERFGYALKPWLAWNWNIRRASEDDLRMYAAHADRHASQAQDRKGQAAMTKILRLLGAAAASVALAVVGAACIEHPISYHCRNAANNVAGFTGDGSFVYDPSLSWRGGDFDNCRIVNSRGKVVWAVVNVHTEVAHYS